MFQHYDNDNYLLTIYSCDISSTKLIIHFEHFNIKQILIILYLSKNKSENGIAKLVEQI